MRIGFWYYLSTITIGLAYFLTIGPFAPLTGDPS